VVFKNYQGQTFRYPLKSTLRKPAADKVDAPITPGVLPSELFS
jgi:hypothetical protein